MLDLVLRFFGSHDTIARVMQLMTMAKPSIGMVVMVTTLEHITSGIGVGDMSGTSLTFTERVVEVVRISSIMSVVKVSVVVRSMSICKI